MWDFLFALLHLCFLITYSAPLILQSFTKSVPLTPRTTHPSPKILVLLSSPTSMSTRSSNSSLDYHPPWSRYSTQCDLWPQHGSASRSSKQRFLVHYNPILTQFYSLIYIPSSADVTSAMTLVPTGGARRSNPPGHDANCITSVTGAQFLEKPVARQGVVKMVDDIFRVG